MPSDIDIPFRHSNASITSKLKKGKIIIKEMGGENKSFFFLIHKALIWSQAEIKINK